MSAPKCYCGHDAYHGTVKKEGASKGKRFFRCPKWPNGSCAFFKWDESWADMSAPPAPMEPQKTTVAVNTEIAALSKRVEILENKLKQIGAVLQ